MKRTLISRHEFLSGFKAGLPALTEGLNSSFAEGSRNQIVQGGGPDAGSFVVPWQGLAGQGDDTGTRLMRPLSSTWGGLKDYFVGSTHIEGRGSIFTDVGLSIWEIGSGVPSIEGLAIAPGIFASTELQVSIARNHQYSAAFTFDAGLPQPSTPDVGIISTPGFGFTGLIEGPISCKIARLRLTTGARSVASQTSAVIAPAKKTVRVTFPLPSIGQDNWAVFFTQSGFGGVGLHYRAAYLLSLDVPESAVAAGTIDGIPRSLEFDFKDGDLVPEVAYIDDYPPPAGTHAVRLANVMCVLGAYGDSTAPVTAADPGTCGAISLPNFYESYKPRNLVYFPEQIVDVLARPTDEYAYVGHRNSITALQYVGVLDGPAVAVSMVWPDIGIAKPHNWCQVHGLLYLFQAKGGPVRMMPDGSPDYSFAAPVRRYMRDWTVEETIVGSHPDSLSVVYFNGREALSWSLQAQKWSPPCYFEDVCVEDHPIPSSSPSASLSPSASISSSPSSSFSASPSASPSASISSSPSSSVSASPSSSASASPSSTPSSSVSASPSSSVSSSPSSSPSNSGSSSPSPSSSPSSSVSPSSSISASPSASPSSSVSSSASASAPDVPFDDTNLELWLAADEMSGVDGNPVYPLIDISGHGRNGTQSSPNAGAQATYHSSGGSNNQPYLSFDGNDIYDLPNFLAGVFSAGHIFVVVKVTNDPALATATCIGPYSRWGTGAGGGNTLFPFTNGDIHDSFGSSTRQSTGNPTPSLTAWRLYEVRSKASQWTSWIDGTQHFNTASNTVAWDAAPLIGGDGAGNFFLGDFHELIFFGADIDASVIADVKSYVASKYSLTIA